MSDKKNSHSTEPMLPQHIYAHTEIGVDQCIIMLEWGLWHSLVTHIGHNTKIASQPSAASGDLVYMQVH